MKKDDKFKIKNENLFMILLILLAVIVSILHYLEKAYLFFKQKKYKNDKKNSTKK